MNRRVLIGILTGLLLALLSACGKGAELNATLAIYTDEGVVLAETAVVFREGQSVLDIVKKATRDAGIQMEYTGTGATAYVKGIDNLYEFDKGPESGWIFSLNGTVCSDGAGTVKPEEGDLLVWQYVLSS